MSKDLLKRVEFEKKFESLSDSEMAEEVASVLAKVPASQPKSAALLNQIVMRLRRSGQGPWTALDHELNNPAGEPEEGN